MSLSLSSAHPLSRTRTLPRYHTLPFSLCLFSPSLPFILSTISFPLSFHLFFLSCLYVHIRLQVHSPSTLDLVFECCTTKWGVYFACTYTLYYVLLLPEESFAGCLLDLLRFGLILFLFIEHLVPVCCLTCACVQLA